ncbi:MAG: hypothetical protein E6Q40_15325 [Cupriavidus sp.]|nr:MAG: hypothetical protein E6Q40_15325 [Cupriavidus sp.]
MRLLTIALFFAAGYTAMAQETGSLNHFFERIEAKAKSFRDGRHLLIVAFGDSITMGSTAKDTLEPQKVYHERLRQKLERQFPAVVFNVINAGVGGDTAGDGLKRVDRDVVAIQPDLVLVAFGANGLGSSEESQAAYKEALGGIVSTIKEKTRADVILLTTPFMASRDNQIVTPGQREQLQRLIALQSSGVVERFSQIAGEVGREKNVAVADVYAAWAAQQRAGVDTTALLANGLNHPTGDAHEIGADAVFDVIMAQWKERRKE